MIKNLKLQPLRLAFLTFFSSLMLLMPQNAMAFPIYAQQAYENPREANGRIVCANCHVRGGLVVTKGSKSLKFTDLKQRGTADIDSIKNIANYGFGYMKGYKSKLKGNEDKVLAEWLIQQSKEGWQK